MTSDFIEVTVDKSHVITIGERLYSESIELIRELVNNAYDADATRVDVTISDEQIAVKDDGSGMDMEGLRQYFNIGSPYKLEESRSPRFGRDRVGQFGIGKFASLAACKRFVVETQKNGFAARVVFDKDEWERHPDVWHLPLETMRPDPLCGSGTAVILENLTKTFDLEDVEDRIVEGVPLKASDFKVFLNGYPVLPRSLSGHRMPIMEGTPFGPLYGEIVILPASGASFNEVGIECKVKGATVRRETFGMETWGTAISRVRGEINADFLPITSDRTGFLKDTPESDIPARLKKKPKAIKKLTPNAMVKRMKFGKSHISCCLDHYGPEKPECFSEGTVIYINRDHPLYKRESRMAATYTMYIARLLTQEVALMKDVRSPRRAFDLQSRLLRDAFLEDGSKAKT